MTSVLPEEESRVLKMKQKLMSDRSAKEETRSFLNFSRENLNISHSDLEQGFNKSRLRPSRNTTLSVAAIVIALLCFCLQSWVLHGSFANAREIEQLQRDVENLKNQVLEQNLMNELNAFKEQLYDESDENDDSSETDINNADYDSDYDDFSSSHDYYSGDYHKPLVYDSKRSDFPEVTSTSLPTPTSPNPGSHKAIIELLSTLRKGIEAKHGQEFENIRENHKNVEREHLKEEQKAQINHEEKISKDDSNKQKRDVLASTIASQERKENIKLKRSVNDMINDDHLMTTSVYQHDERRHIKRTVVSRTHSFDESRTNDNISINSTQAILPWERHPPKKYYVHSHLEAFPSTHDDQLSDEIGRSNRRTNEEAERVGGDERINRRNGRRNSTANRTEIRRPVQNFEVVSRQYRRGLTRRHLRAPRQVYAIHYGADSTLFSTDDEHTGNGRARHNNGVFKAWRPSEWVTDLGMNRHFNLATDGKLTVHEPGLYLIYAQIHYLDEHDENGFHLLANGRPIMQCMVYSPGIGHKSRSCFSAQVTVLQAGDNLILKDVGSARYTLFQYDKSFFGLVKLGESRQQKHQSMSSNR